VGLGSPTAASAARQIFDAPWFSNAAGFTAMIWMGAHGVPQLWRPFHQFQFFSIFITKASRVAG